MNVALPSRKLVRAGVCSAGAAACTLLALWAVDVYRFGASVKTPIATALLGVLLQAMVVAMVQLGAMLCLWSYLRRASLRTTGVTAACGACGAVLLLVACPSFMRLESFLDGVVIMAVFIGVTALCLVVFLARERFHESDASS